MSYLHHIIFDPLSAWESFKVSLLAMPVGLLLMAVCGRVWRKK